VAVHQHAKWHIVPYSLKSLVGGRNETAEQDKLIKENHGDVDAIEMQMVEIF
jgi:hypothetical protein